MAARDIELLRHAWAAFARGDLTGATGVLDPNVRWYGAEDPDAETSCRNRATTRSRSSSGHSPTV